MYRSHKRRFDAPNNIRMFGQSRGTSIPDFKSISGMQDNADIADLRLLSKRMAINISSLEKEIDRIVKKQGKMKLKKMRNARIRHRIRPSTVASVPTLKLAKSGRHSIRTREMGNGTSKSTNDLLSQDYDTLSKTKLSTSRSHSSHQRNKHEFENDINLQAICKSLEQQPSENTDILMYQKKTQTLKRTLSSSAKLSPINPRNLSEVESHACLQNYVNRHPKLAPLDRKIDLSSFTEARRHLYKLELEKKRWATLISKEIKATMTSKMNTLSKWQSRWIVALKHGRILQIFNNIVESDRKNRKETQAKIEAISKIQHSYRQSYSRKMEMKHKRTVEILRKRAWIAKMNVKARHRKRDSLLVKKFCLTFVGRPKFVELIKKFKYKVVICQRFIKNIISVKRSMITAISKYWSQHEPKVLVKMEQEEVERERQRAMRKLQARRRTQIRKKNVAISEREIQKTMSEMAVSIGTSKQDIQRSKARKKAKDKIDSLIDLLGDCEQLKKKHGGVISSKKSQ